MIIFTRDNTQLRKQTYLVALHNFCNFVIFFVYAWRLSTSFSLLNLFWRRLWTCFRFSIEIGKMEAEDEVPDPEAPGDAGSEASAVAQEDANVENPAQVVENDKKIVCTKAPI